jgi:hypothetical protein
VYAAIASAVRYTGGGGVLLPAQKAGMKAGMTKGRVAAIRRKVLSGEALEGDQERDIADRLRQQLGAPQ